MVAEKICTKRPRKTKEQAAAERGAPENRYKWMVRKESCLAIALEKLTEKRHSKTVRIPPEWYQKHSNTL